MRKNVIQNLVLVFLLVLASADGFSQGRLQVMNEQSVNRRYIPTVTQPRKEAQRVMQPASPGVAAAAGTDVLVNNNNGASGTGNFTQSETSVLAFGNNVVIGFNDAGSFQSNNKFTGWSYSTDGGTTFTDGGTLPTSTIGDAGDPVLARNNTTGRIYFSTLGFSGAATIQVFRSDDNGLTWQAPVNGTPGGGSEDKQWITVDNFAGAGNGNVYLMTRNFGSGAGIFFYRSTDNGSTFGPSGGTLITSANQGAFVAVGPDHSVYAFWWTSTALRMRKSTDQGLTFGAPVVVATITAGGTNGDLGLTGLRQGTSTFSSFRSSKFPHAAVNPVNGNLYVTYNDDPAGTDKADVFLVQSTDGGTTWSAPLRINDDATTTDQWQPTVAVMPDGRQLGVFYYSRQEDAANNNLFKYYGRIARINGGSLTFDASFPVSDVASLPEFGRDAVINATYMGDYNTAYTTPNYFHVVWSDNRNDLTGGTPRKDPNVYYDKIYSPGTIPGKNIFVAPTSVNFGDVRVGQTVGPVPVSISNVGDQPLTINSISSPGGDFSVSGLPALPLIIPASGNTTFNVSFLPTSAGAKTGSIVINSNADNTPSVTVSLQGNGVAPPPNDECSNAITVSCGSSVTGNTTFAALDAVPTCNAVTVTAPGIWYKISGTGFPITVSTCNGSFFDTKLSVYSGGCGALTCVAANDNTCGVQSQVTWTSVSGTVYYILVHGGGSATGNFTLTVTCPPVINVTPSPLVINLPSATTGSKVLNIANIAPAGSQNLLWTTASGPYQFKTSDMTGGPVFNWVEISGDGTKLDIEEEEAPDPNEVKVEGEEEEGRPEFEALADDNALQVALPFNFPFFGQFKNAVSITSNGYLTFVATTTSTFTNASIPTAATPNDIVCPFWDDLFPPGGGDVYYKATPTQFIVEYKNIRRFPGGTTELPNTFEVILNADGTILFQYLDMQGTLNSATIGVENSTGTAGTQVAFNQAFVHNNLAVLLNQPNTCSWITSVSPAAGTTAPGGTTPVTVSVNAAGLQCGSTYNCSITITNTSANAPSVTVPVVLNVAKDPCSITAVPSSNVYTGGVPTNLYLGYGPESDTLKVNAPACGAPYTYAWSGGPGLSDYSIGNPVVTPTVPGTFTFSVVVTNAAGYNSTCSITLNVYDIRVPGTNGKKVYICHAPPDNPTNTNTLAVSVNAVADHLTSHAGDKLGSCGQVPDATFRNPLLVAAEQTETGEGIVAYPNPSRGTFSLRLNNVSPGRAEIRIINRNGAVVQSRTVTVGAKGQLVNLSVNAPAGGLYYVQVLNADGTQSTRMLVNK